MQFDDFRKVIDDRNRTLWDEIQEYFIIQVFYHDLPYAKVDTQDLSVQIYCNKNINADSFTHELLHLWMAKKEVTIGSLLKLYIKQNEKLNKVFSEPLLDHIGNTLDHFKMFPKYLELGFDPDKYIFDSHDDKCPKSDLKKIISFYKMLGGYLAMAVDAFIGRFFAVKADHLGKFNYTGCLLKLKNIDERLFDNLTIFWQQWSNYDIEMYDAIEYSYYPIVFDFIDNMEQWIEGKRIVKPFKHKSAS